MSMDCQRYHHDLVTTATHDSYEHHSIRNDF